MPANRIQTKFPIVTLTLGVAFTTASLILVSALLVQTNSNYERVVLQSLQLARLKGEIMRLDEVLTMSARMTAATGDRHWQQRYVDHEAPLDQAIKEILMILPEASNQADARATDEANSRLVSMEKSSFEAVGEGDLKLANSILFGTEYEAQKAIYAKGMNAIAKRLDQHVGDSLDKFKDKFMIAIVVSITLIPLVLLFWAFTLRILGRWKSFVLEVNAGLDAEIARRTDQLETEKVRSLSSAKMATLGEMAGSIAHEINNPLGVIHGFAEHLTDICEDGPLDQAQVRLFAHKITNATDRISRIVQGLRRFSRDGSNDPFDFVGVGIIVDETLSLCQQRLNNQEIKLTVSCPDPKLQIQCRAVEISQVLLNLINNAFDAVSEAPVKEIHVEVKAEGQNVKIIVLDSGPGVPPAIRDRIMQPFFSTKPVGKGTGLGLSISSSIVRAHCGTLQLEASSTGSKFVITLPQTLPVASQQAA